MKANKKKGITRDYSIVVDAKKTSSCHTKLGLFLQTEVH